MKKPKEIRNIVVISDTHVGCQLALMSPDGAELDGGGIAKPSPIQKQIWKVWEEFWGDWIPRATHGEPFIVIHNGDSVDGSHHHATTQWSHNIHDQRRHTEVILKPVVDMCEGRYYHVRGTEAHVGQSGEYEETLAKSLGAIPDRQGRHARWELMKKLGPYLIHASHHIGTTSSSAHETSAVNAELSAFFTNAGRSGRKPPDIIVRSHRHRCSEIRLPSEGGYKVAFVTAAWQGKTPYVYRLPGGRTGSTQIGGSLIRLGDEELHTRHFVRDVLSVEAE
jgi:hypothetical protein